MTDSEKLQLLENFVNKYDLSVHRGPFCDFLFEDRQLTPLTEAQQKTLTYSRNVAPCMTTLLPSDIENAYYAEEFNLTMLYDWYLYKNAGDNPLVWENLNSNEKSLVEGFSNAKQRHGYLHASPDGKIFNGNDGNHRLLTLIIKHFVETHSAKTEDERKAIDERYKMTVPVMHPISQELADALNKIKQQTDYSFFDDKVIPKQARLFRHNAFARAKEDDCLATFNPDLKQFTFTLNGETFVGDEQALIDHLKTKQSFTQPIMAYSTNGTYYISCHNFIWQTKDKQKYDMMLDIVKEMWKSGEISPNEYLTINNLDVEDKQYSIQFNSIIITNEKSDLAKPLAQQILNMLKTEDVSLIDEKTISTLKHNCQHALTFGTLDIPDITIENLSPKEYKSASHFFNKLQLALQQELENDNVLE